jgi:hypothetical protein
MALVSAHQIIRHPVAEELAFEVGIVGYVEDAADLAQAGGVFEDDALIH